ncbi:hypothetical protein [Embleya scabrispora]|uniref:golvesin C-terminal-like domain-containing protein n=1 Tax=Embleya scabrispora TaxID=159449 RepID=UPI00118027C9|nr:hypothetical protein [Embleya scabrispora]
MTSFAGSAGAGERRDSTPAAPVVSRDRAWTTTGDADGFHVMVADARDGYGWRTAASLSEPGFDSDTWIGNACVTGSGERAVVVYAPRTFTNKPRLMARGGFTAVVDLASGQVTKLDLQASLSYYNPGCGVDESAVLTQSPGEDKTSTRLVRVDAVTGALAPAVETKGQVTSAVPVKDGGIVAADGGALVRIEANGASTRLATTRGVPFRLTADKDGGVVFLDKLTAPTGAKTTAAAPERAAAERVTAGQIREPDAKKTKPTELAAGPLTETGLTRDAAGTVYVTGPAKQTTGKLPDIARLLPGSPKDAKVGTRGESVLTRTAWADGKDTRVEPDAAVAARPVSIDLTIRATGRTASAVVDPAAKPAPHIGQGRDRSPRLPAPKDPQAAPPGSTQTLTDPRPPGSSTQIVEAERTCAVPRNDPRNQAMQPKPRQVEWAVDQAIVGNLDNKVSRPANWKNLGMPAYRPQAMFPLQALSGGGSRVPAQVMLGVTAQESNMWQASRTTVPGVTGNPLIGNYYGINYYDGIPGNDWDIDWSKADCGYGITQVTDHMRLAGREDGKLPAWDYQQQRAVALDYTANIAAGLQILVEKWNVTHDNGLIVNNGNSAKIENWYFALWAYNSGFYPNPGDGGPWGVGWANNPANPEWDAGRLPFLEKADGSDNYPDAAHPQDWPYQEKVIGWAGHPLEGLESPGKMVAGYRQAWWNGRDGDATTVGNAKYYRAQAKPPEGLFCAPENACDATKITDGASNDPGVGPCTRADHKCWWNEPVTYKLDCDYSCGNDLVRFNTTYPEEADGTAYPPNCALGGLPAGALVIDDLADNVPSIRPNCGHPWTNAGTFTMTFGNDPGATSFPAKVDTHQLGGGFGGHFYFAHTRVDDAKGQLLKVTGAWKLDPGVWQANKKPGGEVEVKVHLPDHGAQTTATYEVRTDDGPQFVTVDQRTAGSGSGNRWVDIGRFRFGSAVPEVRLAGISPLGTGDKDIAFDAIAVVPGEFSHMPDIVVPDADPDAPDREAVEVPQPVNGTPSAKAADRDCGAPDPATGIRTCIRSGPLTSAMPTTSAIPGAGLVPWCSTYLDDRVTRFEGCLHSTVTAVFVDQNEEQVGAAPFAIQQEFRLNKDLAEFDQALLIVPIEPIPPVFGQINLSTFTARCPGNCGTSGTAWNASRTWLAGDGHALIGNIRNTWTNTQAGPGIQETMQLDWQLMFTTPKSPKPASTTWNKPDLRVRCDKFIGGRPPGCVFPEYTPSYLINTAREPIAAAMYWVAQKRLPGHYGDKDAKSPLTRVDDATRKANRGVLCELAVAEWVKHPRTTGSSCDEYAFAVTKQSGRTQSGVTSGKQCAQFFAEQQPDKSWKLDYDTRVSPMPTWNEPCARGSIPLAQNSGAANRIGILFFANNRVLVGDDWYAQTPGFENCDPMTVCHVSTRG